MFGYQPKELVEKHVLKLFPKWEDEMLCDSSLSFLSAIRQSVGKIIEVVACRKDKSCFYADLLIASTIIEDEQIFVCTIRDVTERKQIEEVKKQRFTNLEHIVEERTLELTKSNLKLQKEIDERKRMADHLFHSQERFRKIFESSPCLMAILSQKDLTFIDVNTSWTKYIGYSCNELVHQKINSENFIDEATKTIVDLTKKIRNKKIRYETKNGEVRSGLLSTELIDIHSEPCMLVVLTDITDRVHLENEMYRLDRLNLIGEMAAGIAHEIRNPMTTVQGFLQLSRNKINQLSTDIVDLMLEELRQSKLDYHRIFESS